MCDTAKYMDIYKDIEKLSPEDTLQLMEEAKSKEQKEFFAMIGNYILKQKQEQVIARDLF